jgi:hypothetical protein
MKLIPLEYKELTWEEVDGLEKGGISSETYYEVVDSQGISSEEYLIKTERGLGSLQFRAYRGMKAKGVTPDDIAGYVVLSQDDLAEERRELSAAGNPFPAVLESIAEGSTLLPGQEFHTIGIQFFYKTGRKK